MSHLPRRAPSVEAWNWLILATAIYVSAWLLTSHEVLGFWLFQATFVAVAGLFLYWHVQTHEGDILHPLVITVLLLYLYATGSSLYVIEEGCTFFEFQVGPDIVDRFHLCCVIGLVGLVMGAWAGQCGSVGTNRQAPVRASWAVPDPECWIKLLVYGVVLALPAMSSVLSHFDPSNVRSYDETCFESRIVALDNPGQVILGVLAAIPAQYLFAGGLLALLRQKYVPLRIFAGVLVGLYVLVPLQGGFRGLVIGPAIMALAVFHYRVKRIGMALFASVVLVGYLFVTAMSIARQTSDLGAMVDIVLAEVRDGNTDRFSLRNSTELLAAQNLMNLMQFIDSGQTSFTYGASIWNDLVVFVPRALYPNRPLAMAQQFAELVNEGATDAGMGYGFFILQEGYWICGVPGVFVTMFFVGWGVEKLYAWFMRRMAYDIVALAYGGFLAVCAASVRSGILIQIKAALMLIVPFFVLGRLPSFTAARGRLREIGPRSIPDRL